MLSLLLQTFLAKSERYFEGIEKKKNEIFAVKVKEKISATFLHLMISEFKFIMNKFCKQMISLATRLSFMFERAFEELKNSENEQINA